MSQPPVSPQSGPPGPDPQPPFGQPPAPGQPYPAAPQHGSYPPPPPGQDAGYPPPGSYPQPPSAPQPGGYPPPNFPESGGYPPPSYPEQGGYPPGGQPPPGYPQAAGYPPIGAPVPPKKSKALKIVLISLAVVLLLCLGGAAVTYYALRDKVADVVDATSTRLVTPDTLGGRAKVTLPELQATADGMVTDMKSAVPNATSTVAAFYGDIAKQDLVMIAGASGLILDPGKQLDDAIKSMGSGGLSLSNVTTIEPGPLGGTAKCGDSDTGGLSMGVCVWADRGSLGVIAMFFKKAEDVKAEFQTIRAAVEKRE